MAKSKKKATKRKQVPSNTTKLGKALVQFGTALQGTASAKAYKALGDIKDAMSAITKFDDEQRETDSYLSLLCQRLDLEDPVYAKIGPMLPTMLPVVLEAAIEYRDRLKKKS